MTYIKCETSDGFVVIDIEGAAVATGVLRVARKLLVDGAWNLARSATYSAASFGLEVSGASAGVNVDGEGRDAAVATVVAELAARTGSPTLALDAGKGCTPNELTELTVRDPRSPARFDDGLLAIGIVAAAEAALGSLEGTTVAIEPGLSVDLLDQKFRSRGASMVEMTDGLISACDVLCIGSRPALIDHDLASALRAKVIVPAGPLPVTARGLAVARREGVMVLPDFVSLAAPMVVGFAGSTTTDVGERIAAVITEVADHPEGHFLGACERAESFLDSWANVPFGRPLP